MKPANNQEMALQVTHADAAILLKRDRYEDPAMLQTLKDTVAKGATDAQFRMFVEVCRSTGLNPFLKEIYYVPEKGIIMAGRDGYLRVANEHPMFDGMTTVVDRDEKTKIPIKATCTVWRKDRNHPIVCEAFFNEYQKSSPVWNTYKSAMIAKVSEVLALKRSFSINGVVTEEEVGEQVPATQHEPRGTADAAKALGETKVRALVAGATRQEAEQIHEAEFVMVDGKCPHCRYPSGHADYCEFKPVPVPSNLEATLEASIKQVNTSKNFKMLENFSLIKKEIGATEYYRILGDNGFEKSNQITDVEVGRKIYVKMGKRLAEMRLEAADREESAAMKEA